MISSLTLILVSLSLNAGFPHHAKEAHRRPAGDDMEFSTNNDFFPSSLSPHVRRQLRLEKARLLKILRQPKHQGIWDELDPTVMLTEYVAPIGGYPHSDDALRQRSDWFGPYTSKLKDEYLEIIDRFSMRISRTVDSDGVNWPYRSPAEKLVLRQFCDELKKAHHRDWLPGVAPATITVCCQVADGEKLSITLKRHGERFKIVRLAELSGHPDLACIDHADWLESSALQSGL